MSVLQVQAPNRSKARAFLDFLPPDRSFGLWKRRKIMTHKHLGLPLVLFASCAVLAMPVGQARAIDVGVTTNAGNAVSANAGASLGGGGGVDATANASVGGSNGVNADATANAGDSNGLGANANAGLGGGRGVNADINARTGGFRGIDTKATASVGGASGEGATAAAPDATADAAEARTLDAFRSMPADQRRKILIRCVDISASGGSDAGLAGLCQLLRITASR
ncbi:hypothetical protein EFB14_05510 [Rhizobium fabae]|uniref:Uncharacterized protein n=2 Tax=Rhizobium fabae TaxID=573179 RepID=A0ABY0BF71_9HYPH|nr:hypothetical protein EFB14_05510 [Rhizobium fabae]